MTWDFVLSGASLFDRVGLVRFRCCLVCPSVVFSCLANDCCFCVSFIMLVRMGSKCWSRQWGAILCEPAPRPSVAWPNLGRIRPHLSPELGEVSTAISGNFSRRSIWGVALERSKVSCEGRPEFRCETHSFLAPIFVQAWAPTSERRSEPPEFRSSGRPSATPPGRTFPGAQASRPPNHTQPRSAKLEHIWPNLFGPVLAHASQILTATFSRPDEVGGTRAKFDQ